jgi:hypothetical protein
MVVPRYSTSVKLGVLVLAMSGRRTISSSSPIWGIHIFGGCDVDDVELIISLVDVVAVVILAVVYYYHCCCLDRARACV